MGRIWAWSYLPRAASIVHGRAFQRENFERTVMNRRRFLAATAVGAGAGISSVAMPAIAQSMPQIRWRLAASWPKSLDTLYGSCEVFAKRVAEITDNRLQLQLFAAGEIVPGLAVLDAVQNQTVEIGSTAAYYYVGKDAALAFLVPQCHLVSTRDRWNHGSCMAVATICCRRYSRASTATASQWVIPAARWAAGFARKSTGSRICGA